LSVSGARSTPIVWFDEVGSTSDLAREHGQRGVCGPQWFAARRQTQGRGRLGRAWHSPQGNLYATLIMSWPYGLDLAAKVSFAAGLAVEACLEHYLERVGYSRSLRLKWPNDVLLGGSKISGVLVETSEGEAGRWLSVGVGVNLSQAPDLPDRPTTALSAMLNGPTPSPEAFLSLLSERMDRQIEKLRLGGFDAMRLDWLARAFGLGEAVCVRLDGQTCEGIFETLDNDGALVISQSNGLRRRVTAGEVQVLSSA